MMKDLTPGNNPEESSNSVVTFPGNKIQNEYNKYASDSIEATYVEEDEINLRDLWQVLVRRKWVVLLFFCIIVAATIIATYLTTPIYRSSLTLQINRDAPKVLDFQDATQSESIFEKDYYQTQYELLKSRSLAVRVIDQIGLRNNPAFLGKNNKKTKDFALDSNESVEKQKQQEARLVNVFLSNLTIEPVKRSKLVKIHFDSPDPRLAADIANATANNFINMNLERRFEASSYAKTFIDDRLRQVKANLEDSERELIQFARDNEIINLTDEQPIVVKQLQQVNSALANAEERRVEAEAIYREMLDTKGQGLNKILDSNVIQQLKGIKADLEAEYQEKLNLYKPAYPTMLQLNGRISDINRKIEDEINNIRSAIFANYRAQKREEDMLVEKLSDIKDKVLALQDRSIQYKVIKRDTDTNKQLYQGLLQRMKEVGVAGGIISNNITIIDKAETPNHKHKPNPSLNRSLAMIFGLIGGVFLAFFFEYFDDTIKTPEDLEKLSQLPVLGLVPEFKSLSASDEKDVDIGLMSFNDPRSAIAEAYRSTRTALQFSTVSGAPSVLLVTSTSPGEGKTTSAINIATTFCQLGNKVLLIDTDLRNPSIHNSLQINNTKGLTNYLAGDAEPADISTHTCVTRLFAIPSGPLPPNPAELLSSEKMLKLLELAKGKFDRIVLDGPPVMGLADALVLANVADGTVVVVESGKTRQEHLQVALKRLQTTTSSVVGGVLSKYSPINGEYDYYSNYYNYEPGHKNRMIDATTSSQRQITS